ncbi:MAG: hypothetical protein Q7V53_04980 [Caldisericota bacterium]|nr:hypothetical protein [Caldisericota bacterium]
MKRSKMVWVALLFSLMVFALPATAHAGLGVPSSVWNLSTQGQYNFSGLAEASTLYSNYKFTGVTSTKISVSNKSTSSNLKVQLVRDDAVFDTAVSTVTIPKNGTSTWTVTGLSSSNRYYLKFYAPSNFSGYIRKP